jgi:hypothetical protein
MFEVTDFETGFNGWQFKFWMPNKRIARAEIEPTSGLLKTNGVRFYADGRGDDGIFFLEKIFRVSPKLSCISVSWFFADFDPHTPVTAWPRVVYVGPPRDLAQPDTQHVFTWLTDVDRLTHLGDGRWNQQHYLQNLSPCLEVQVCLGWKINWETERVSYIDGLVVIGV